MEVLTGLESDVCGFLSCLQHLTQLWALWPLESSPTLLSLSFSSESENSNDSYLLGFKEKWEIHESAY